VLVLIGPPLALHGFRAAHASDPVAAVQRLTAELQRRLEELTLELPRPELLPLVRRTVRLLRRPGDGVSAPAPGREVLSEHASARRVAEALAWAERERPAAYAAYADRLACHAGRRARLGLSDAALAGSDPPPRRGTVLRRVALPLSLAGAALHWLPYRLTGAIARRLRPDPTKEATVKFTAGAALFTLWFALAAGTAWLVAGPPAALLAVVLLALAGWAALRHLSLPAELRAWGRARLRFAPAPDEVARLAAEREELAREARSLWDAFHGGQPAW
jgi:hypothetical protein